MEVLFRPRDISPFERPLSLRAVILPRSPFVNGFVRPAINNLITDNNIIRLMHYKT